MTRAYVVRAKHRTPLLVCRVYVTDPGWMSRRRERARVFRDLEEARAVAATMPPDLHAEVVTTSIDERAAA